MWRCSKQIRKLISNPFLFWHREWSLFEDWHRLITFWDYRRLWTTGYETNKCIWAAKGVYEYWSRCTYNLLFNQPSGKEDSSRCSKTKKKHLELPLLALIKNEKVLCAIKIKLNVMHSSLSVTGDLSHKSITYKELIWIQALRDHLQHLHYTQHLH